MGKRIISGVIIILAYLVFTIRVSASGGEETEGSQLEQFEKNLSEQEEEIFYNFDDMSYCLFLETQVGCAISLDYTRYGIFDNCTKTRQDGEKLYFELNKKMLGNEMELSTHEEWANYSKDHIVEVSPDLEWVVSRKYEEPFSSKYSETWYQNKKEIKTFTGIEEYDMKQLIMRRTDSGEYEVMSEQEIQEIEQFLEKFYGMDFSECEDKWICFDEKGKLLAIREPNDDAISVYSIDGVTTEKLYTIRIPLSEMNWPIEISQISGNDEKGWIVFSSGDVTYRMNYPDGSSEKIGEFMFGTTYSPDEKYRAYCTANNFLFYSWEDMDEEKLPLYFKMREKWDQIPAGWYVEELETGNKTYIPVETWKWDVDRPLYGGRCVWIQKDKLLQVLNS